MEINGKRQDKLEETVWTWKKREDSGRNMKKQEKTRRNGKKQEAGIMSIDVRLAIDQANIKVEKLKTNI